MLGRAEIIRQQANDNLLADNKGALGQYFTNMPIAQFMASLFSEIKGEIHLLDPGCGSGMLSAAFINEAIRRDFEGNIYIDAFDVDDTVQPFFDKTMQLCQEEAKRYGICVHSNLQLADYLLYSVDAEHNMFSCAFQEWTHCILNPPYKKISASSAQRKTLKNLGIDVVNLYAGFVA